MTHADQQASVESHVHDWKVKTFHEPMFQIAWGAERVCLGCGKKQYCDFTAGRTGGNWKDVVVGSDGGPKVGTEPSI